MILLLLMVWPFWIIYFLFSFLECEMDDCMGGYDEFTVWERIKMKLRI